MDCVIWSHNREVMMQFLVGLGAGGATFVRQLSAWTLGSIGGFSNASSRVLARALQTQPAARCCREYFGSFAHMPSHLDCAALLICTVTTEAVFRCHATSQMPCM